MGKAWTILGLFWTWIVYACIVRRTVASTSSDKNKSTERKDDIVLQTHSELDNTTYGTYYTYALSDFQNISASSAVIVACNLVFALMKPFWAKISDIYGRGIMYPVALVFVSIGLVVSAAAKNFASIAAGIFIRVMGMTGINSMNDVIIAVSYSRTVRSKHWMLTGDAYSAC